jgi:hypothetical protein
MDSDEFIKQAEKLLKFMAAHPELDEQVAMWQVSSSTLEITDPEAAALLAKELPEFKG